MLAELKVSDGTNLSYLDQGHGPLALFQHGFGMDWQQIHEIWPAQLGIRLICLNLRGHGDSETGSLEDLSFARAVKDILELIVHLGEEPKILGGISLGAALAMELTQYLSFSHLIISRPAFDVEGNTSNFDVFRALQRIMRDKPQNLWLTQLEHEACFQALANSAPRNQETYRRLLEHPRLSELMVWMNALEVDAMTINNKTLKHLKPRTDIIEQTYDALHPFTLARKYRDLIPNSNLHTVASGKESESKYQESMRTILHDILREN